MLITCQVNRYSKSVPLAKFVAILRQTEEFNNFDPLEILHKHDSGCKYYVELSPNQDYGLGLVNTGTEGVSHIISNTKAKTHIISELNDALGSLLPFD